jgi:hypothetical protein
MANENEANNTRAAANTLALASLVKGQLSSSTDQDWFAITAAYTGGLTLNWDGPTNSTLDYFNLSVYDASGVLQSNYQTGVDGAYSFAATANKTYYVGVSMDTYVSQTRLYNGGLQIFLKKIFTK